MVDCFKRELKSEHKLGKYEILDKRTNKISIRYSIQISSNKMIQDLIDLNVRQKKSFTSEYPKIDEKYFWSFFRGLFDGDGCITKDKNKYVFSIIAAEKLMIMIQKQMSLLKIINTKLSVVATKNNTIIYRYKKSKKSDLIKIYNKMYENNDFSLERDFKLNPYTSYSLMFQPLNKFFEISFVELKINPLILLHHFFGFLALDILFAFPLTFLLNHVPTL